MPGIRISGGGAISATVDDGIARIVERAARRVAADTVAEVETATREVYDEAYRTWPVGKDKPSQPYHSRDRLSWAVETDGETVSGHVRNDAPWAVYVRPRKLWGAYAVVELLRRPMRKQATKLARSLARRLATTLSGEG